MKKVRKFNEIEKLELYIFANNESLAALSATRLSKSI